MPLIPFTDSTGSSSDSKTSGWAIRRETDRLLATRQPQQQQANHQSSGSVRVRRGGSKSPLGITMQHSHQAIEENIATALPEAGYEPIEDVASRPSDEVSLPPILQQYHHPHDSESVDTSQPPLLEIPEEIYAVRKAALQVMKPLTKTWVRFLGR